MDKKRQKLLNNIGMYVVVIGMLAIINLMTSRQYFWFIWPALGWGVAIAGQIIAYLTGDPYGTLDDEDESNKHDDIEDKNDDTQTAETVNPIVENQPSNQQKITNKTLQAHLKKALAYKDQIAQIAESNKNESVHPRLQSLSTQINDWVATIEDLAQRVDGVQQNDLVQQDLESVPQSIERLEAQLNDETDPDIKTALERTLANRKRQLSSLERLQSLMSRAEIQMENTLSSLGTIYSQVLTDQSTNQVADYSHLSEEAEEQTRVLQDHLEALTEVKLGDR